MNGIQESRQHQKTAQAANHPTGTKKESEKLTQKRVRELLDYDPETGLLTWKVNRRGRGTKVGGKAGSLNMDGYLRISIDSRTFLAHRVIWLWYYGYLPENEIDHINRVRSDNRICNLREVSRTCNLRNSCVSISNRSGVKGVSVDKQGCRAFIVIERRWILIKGTKDFTEAVAHRLAAEQCLGYNSCDARSSAYLYMEKYLKEVKAQS